MIKILDIKLPNAKYIYMLNISKFHQHNLPLIACERRKSQMV